MKNMKNRNNIGHFDSRMTL